MASDSPPVRARLVATVALIGYLALAVELLCLGRRQSGARAGRVGDGGRRRPCDVDRRDPPTLAGPVAALAALGVVGGVAALVASGRNAAELLIVVATIAITSAAGMWALAWEIRSAVTRRWSPATRARHGVLLMNAKSGGGKVERFDLQG